MRDRERDVCERQREMCARECVRDRELCVRAVCMWNVTRVSLPPPPPGLELILLPIFSIVSHMWRRRRRRSAFLDSDSWPYTK